jgi:hypothetical protein
MIMKTYTFLLLLLSTFTTSSFAQGEWKFIADKTVNYGVDRDVIHLGDFRDDFRQIKLHVTSAPLRIFDMKIHFDNGDVQDVSLRAVIPQGGDSRVIDLMGGVRHIQKIEFWYKPGAKGRKGQSRVAVWGRV